MKKTLILAICVATSLSACGTSSSEIVGQELYIKTLETPTDKIPSALALCVETKLKEYQASAHVRPITTDLWMGTVPSTDSDQPQATVEISLPTHGRGAIHANMKVLQRQPVVEEINDVLRQCL